MNLSTLSGLAQRLLNQPPFAVQFEELFDEEVQRSAGEYALIAVAHFEMRMARDRVAPKILLALAGLIELLGRRGEVPEGADVTEVLPVLASEQTWPIEDIHAQVHAATDLLIPATDPKVAVRAAKDLAAKMIHLWALNEARAATAATRAQSAAG